MCDNPKSHGLLQTSKSLVLKKQLLLPPYTWDISTSTKNLEASRKDKKWWGRLSSRRLSSPPLSSIPLLIFQLHVAWKEMAKVPGVLRLTDRLELIRIRWEGSTQKDLGVTMLHLRTVEKCKIWQRLVFSGMASQNSTSS